MDQQAQTDHFRWKFVEWFRFAKDELTKEEDVKTI